MNLPNQGNGADQFKAQVIQWIHQELAKAAQGGIGLHLDGATGNLIIDNGDVRSGNYVAGSAGWDLAPSGSAELGPTTVRGGKLQSGNYVAGTSGWGLDGAGNAEFNSLTLRGGIIGNDALTNPVIPAYGYANANTYPLPAGQANRVTRATINFTVPAGCTQALIAATSQDTGMNSGAGFDYLFSYVLIGGTGGAWAYEPSPTTPAGYQTTSLATMTNLITGLTGGQVITVASQPYTSVASWASSSNNSTIVSATCLFLR